MKIYKFEEIPSTNVFAESLKSLKEDAIIIAKRQSGGMGSKNRSFSSEEGGLYITFLRFYKELKACELFKIMVNTSLAVCKSLEKFSLKPKIKWPNDVYVNGKKICGILISNSFSGEYVANSVIGIGINVNNPLPEELEDIATSFKREGVSASVKEVEEELIKNMSEEFTLEEYKKYSLVIGKEVLLITDEKNSAAVLDIDGLGRLKVNIGGEIKYISAGEVSLRF